jgi:tRNA pseudouridine38-40 synthase
VESTLNVEAMRKAMSVLIGTHDFSAFCANSFKETPNQVRTIMRFEVEESEDELRFIIEGDGFMRYQIRMMMACILDIGKGKLRITDLKHILDSKDKQAYSGMAEACGLYLTEVEYR